MKEVFSECSFILSSRQPPNLLQQLSSAKYTNSKKEKLTSTPSITLCKDKRCKICQFYLQTDLSFSTASGKVWNVKCNMSCNSINVIYFLKCNRCKGKVSYIGKTNNLCFRTNQHISTSRSGNGSNQFDQHVFNCNQKCLRTVF